MPSFSAAHSCLKKTARDAHRSSSIAQYPLTCEFQRFEFIAYRGLDEPRAGPGG